MIGRTIILIFAFWFVSYSPNYGTDNEKTIYAVKAFPTAMGFGQNATGGKGGYVVAVTNTNFSGSGSLKEALEMTGARTIVFRVGGTISNTGSTYLTIPIGSGNVTIAGETAPGGGILIRGAMLSVRASNVIVRHIRFRQDVSTSTGSNNDAVTIDGTQAGGGPITNIIFDHCSVSGGLDGNFDIRNTWGMTVQNCIFSYGGKSNLINNNSKNISYIQNIFALVNERTVRANTIAHLDLTLEEINNLIYGVNYPGGPSEGLKFTLENNITGRPSGFTPGASDFFSLPAPNPENGETNTIENTYAYISGNDVSSGGFSNVIKSKANPYLENSPLYRSSYIPLSTTGLKELLLSNSGAGIGTSQGLDGLDQTILGHISAETGSISSSFTFPNIASGTPYTDSDSDGMDDAWETTTFGNLSKGNNGFDLSADYTNLQMFLSYLAGDESTPPPAPTCSDGIQNGDETGIDCGGSCSPCGGIEPGTGAGARAFMNYLLTD